MKLSVSEMLDLADKAKTDDERVMILKKHSCPALHAVLKGAYDPRIVWLLPEGDPPYKPNELPDAESVFHYESRRLYLFVEGGNNNLKQLRREALFVELLEMVHKDDAKLLLAVKDKTLPYENITSAVAYKTFPELFR